ncbi:MAG: hypothetical protein V3R51_04155 [Gammaproteobacteria bacterium]
MKSFTVMSTAVALALGLSFTGLALANDDSDSDGKQPWSSHPRTSGSGSGDFVCDNGVNVGNCGGCYDGSDFVGQTPASATLEASYDDGNSTSKIKVKNARPNTHYTVWVRLKGTSHGTAFGSGPAGGGSPVTNGGATPYAPTSELADLISDWASTGGVGCIPPGTASASVNCTAPRANGFVTDANGKGGVTVNADFTSIAGGAYPFNRMSAATLAVAVAKTLGSATAVPTAIADPRDANNTPGTPFLYRMVSHCKDDASHGLSPGARETWFNFP